MSTDETQDGPPSNDDTMDTSFAEDSPGDLEFGVMDDTFGDEASESQPKQPVLGDYVLLRKIGSGGMGQVFKAQHRRMERLVALKMLSPAVMKDPEAVDRFHREVKAAARLFHPHIVTAFDAGEQNGVHYLVMEYVQGQSLAKLIEETGKLPVEKAIAYVLQAAEGLKYAHDHDVVHRDIKPSNLILTDDGTVKILDMGTARVDTATTTGDLTGTGVILGTINYMSPEQARDSKHVDHRSDIYSLGCTFYFLLTGKAPFEGSLVQTLLAHAQTTPPSLLAARDDVPPYVDAVLQKMLAKDANERYQTIDEFVAGLERGEEVGSAPATLDEVVAGSSKPAKAQPAIKPVGVDLGTSFSRAATLGDDGRPLTLTMPQEQPRMASEVFIDKMNVIIGGKAYETATAAGQRVADSAKRAIGQTLYPRMLSGTKYPPEVLLSLVLSQVVVEARQKIGDFNHVVLSVPGCFGEMQRKAMEDVGYIAGLEVLDVINDPVATALAYAHRSNLFESTTKKPHHLLVIDLGGGTFDVAVIRVRGHKLTTMSSGGDAKIGGYDFDSQLAVLIVERFMAKHGIDPRKNPLTIAKLRRDCELARRALAQNKKVLLHQRSDDRELEVRISPDKFRVINANLIEQVRSIIGKTLRAANLNGDRLNEILLVGGLSAMPMVREVAEQFVGPNMKLTVLEDDIVAQGAALYASLLADQRRGEQPAIELENVSSHAVGVMGIDRSTGEPANAVLIPRNTRLPFSTKRSFKTPTSGQESMLVNIVEGEGASPDTCTPLGRCVIEDLPADLPADSDIDVEFQYSSSGRLTVFVESAETGYRAAKTISRASGLNNVELSRWREWVETMMLCSNFF